MRFTPLLSAVALMAISGLAPAQQALQSEDPSSVTFGWENIMATGTEFTAEGWVRANPNCLSGDYYIFSRFDPSVTCTEHKSLRIGSDGTVLSQLKTVCYLEQETQRNPSNNTRFAATW